MPSGDPAVAFTAAPLPLAIAKGIFHRHRRRASAIRDPFGRAPAIGRTKTHGRTSALWPGRTTSYDLEVCYRSPLLQACRAAMSASLSPTSAQVERNSPLG